MNVPAGVKVWLMCLVIFDENGQARILKSFAKPAKDSIAKQDKTVKSKPNKVQATQQKDVELF